MTLRIVARHRGPLVLQHDGPVELVAPDGSTREIEPGRRVLLCRCGVSETRPLCDGSHNRTNFEAPEAPSDEDADVGAGA